jgi:hypothetical protein
MMSSSSRLARAALITATGALLAGCSSGSAHQNVFTMLTGFTGSFPTHVDEISDVGLPGLYNTSDHAVQLRRVQLVAQPSAVHVLNVRAYNSKQVGYGDVGSQAGDLHAECPKQFVPHPITSFTIPPHKLARYFVVIAFTISKPGTYHLGKAKIYYRTGGTTKWQYQNLNTTVKITNPPRPGLRPQPASAVCGRP